MDVFLAPRWAIDCKEAWENVNFCRAASMFVRERLCNMSTPDASLRSLLLPVREGAANQRKTAIAEQSLASQHAGDFESASWHQPSALSVHFEPFLEAYKRLAGASTESDFALSKTIGVLSPQLGSTINTLPFPCLSTNLDEMIHSMMTVLEQLGDNKHFPGHPEFVDDVRRVPAVPLMQCLSCDLCFGPMKDPHTSLPCLHSFCRRCIRTALQGAEVEKKCPVRGCGTIEQGRFCCTSLGTFPFNLENPTIVRDETLHKLSKNIFHEEDLDKEQEVADSFVPSTNPETSHLIQDVGPMRHIQTRSLQNSRSDKSTSMTSEMDDAQRDSMDYVTVAVFAREEQQPEFDIEYNYFYVPGGMTVRQFRRHLENRFTLNSLQLYCNDVRITDGSHDEMALIEVCDEFWFQFNEDNSDGDSSTDVFTLRYQCTPISSENTNIG